MVDWPLSLPQDVSTNGYSEPFGSGAIRTEMEMGVAKQRSRYTAVVKTFEIDMLMTSDQVDELIDFYEVALVNGVSQFTWKHPRTKASASMRFVAPPAARPRDTLYDVSMSLEIIP